MGRCLVSVVLNYTMTETPWFFWTNVSSFQSQSSQGWYRHFPRLVETPGALSWKEDLAGFQGLTGKLKVFFCHDNDLICLSLLFCLWLFNISTAMFHLCPPLNLNQLIWSLSNSCFSCDSSLVCESRNNHIFCSWNSPKNRLML